MVDIEQVKRDMMEMVSGGEYDTVEQSTRLAQQLYGAVVVYRNETRVSLDPRIYSAMEHHEYDAALRKLGGVMTALMIYRQITPFDIMGM